ncbi:DUF3039 domain-containing protein [Kribbella endophytica]
MHNRRARPTLRVLKDDLTSGWDSTQPQRQLSEGDFEGLHRLSELPHPIVVKAVESFGTDHDDDNHAGAIKSSTKIPLLEIKFSQWRGGVWEDPADGVCWLVVAGLAKGGHLDRDDFYRRVQRENDSGVSGKWLPTDKDRALLRQETAARLMLEWELGVQRQALEALEAIHAGGNCRFKVPHPSPKRPRDLAEVELTVDQVRNSDIDTDDVLLEVRPASDDTYSLIMQLETRMLISINPPEQDWDTSGNHIFSNMGDVGAWTERVVELRALCEANELAISEPGTASHYTHRAGLFSSTVEGRAVRALCGVYFVPTQDHEQLPKCDNCSTKYSKLPEFG